MSSMTILGDTAHKLLLFINYHCDMILELHQQDLHPHHKGTRRPLGASGGLREPLGASTSPREPLGAPAGLCELPEGSGSVWEPPGAPGRLHEEGMVTGYTPGIGLAIPSCAPKCVWACLWTFYGLENRRAGIPRHTA